MKRRTLFALCLLVGALWLPVTDAHAAYGDDRTAGSAAPTLNLSASAMRAQVAGNGNNDRVQLASAVGTPTQLLPDEAALPSDLSALKAAQVVVYKGERRMDILDSNGRPLRSYQVSLGRSPKGDKIKQGDNRTPEGRYTIDWRNPNSSYHRSLRISYPSKSDQWRAQKQGVNPGGDIFIHGLPNGKGWKRWKYNKGRDWTNGCIAVYDDEIREIWEMVPDGTPIIIKP